MSTTATTEAINHDRRQFLSTAALGVAVAGAASLLPEQLVAATEDNAIRPFRVNVPEADLVDLRRRVKATRWPDKETVTDQSQGVQLATIQKLARYWSTEYDWRKCEAQLKIVDPLTNPTAHGASASDAFHLVIPSIPGYGFSGKPTTTGWDPVRIARAWTVLMKRLGYTRFVAQGGDWGDSITEQMALQAPPELLGIHTNMPATVPADIQKALHLGSPVPSGLSPDDRHPYTQLDVSYRHGLGYANEMANRPQTLYGIADSPVGLAAWILDHDS